MAHQIPWPAADAVSDAFHHVGMRVTTPYKDSWTLHSRNGIDIAIEAHLRERWLILTGRPTSAPVPNADLGRFARLLALNDTTGPIRVVLDPALHTCIRADIMLADEPINVENLAAVCNGINALAHAACVETPSGNLAARNLVNFRCPQNDETVDWSAVCSEAGWTHHKRDDGSIIVPIDAAGKRHEAILCRPGALPESICVEVLSADEVSDTSAGAISALVLMACYQAHGVRPVRTPHSGRFQFQTLLEGPHRAEALNAALSAFTLACSLCREESRACLDEAVAARLLEILVSEYSNLEHTVREDLSVCLTGENEMTTAVSQTISITASDVTRQQSASVNRVPADATVGELVDELLSTMRLPKNDSEGRPLSYHARLDREGRHLRGAEKVTEALQESDHLVLQPNVDAG